MQVTETGDTRSAVTSTNERTLSVVLFVLIVAVLALWWNDDAQVTNAGPSRGLEVESPPHRVPERVRSRPSASSASQDDQESPDDDGPGDGVVLHLRELVGGDAIAGARALGEAVRRSPKTRLHACGHTHHEREHADADGRRWINLGCGYDRKRWLVYDVDSGEASWGPWLA